MSDAAYTNIEILTFVIVGYIAVCCIAIWQHQLRRYVSFPNTVDSLTALHTALSIGLVIGR